MRFDQATRVLILESLLGLDRIASKGVYKPSEVGIHLLMVTVDVGRPLPEHHNEHGYRSRQCRSPNQPANVFWPAAELPTTDWPKNQGRCAIELGCDGPPEIGRRRFAKDAMMEGRLPMVSSD